MDKPLFAKERDMTEQNKMIFAKGLGHFRSVLVMADEIRKRIDYDKQIDDQRIAARKKQYALAVPPLIREKEYKKNE